MKRYFSITAVAVALFSFSSCSKDYTCECKTTVGGTQTGISTITVTGKKSDAKETCENGSSSQTVGGVTQSVVCTIKD